MVEISSSFFSSTENREWKTIHELTHHSIQTVFYVDLLVFTEVNGMVKNSPVKVAQGVRLLSVVIKKYSF